MINKKIAASILALSLPLFLSGQEPARIDSTSAQTPEAKDTAIYKQELIQQLQEINYILLKNDKSSRNWWYGWAVGYGAATVAQGAVAIVSTEKSTRQDMVLGAGTTLLGVAGQLIGPLQTGYDPKRFSGLQKLSETECYARLFEAEAILKEQVTLAKESKDWKAHVLSGAVNVASGLITWFGFDRTFKDCVENVLINTAITELQIWTRPSGIRKDYEEYCKRYYGGGTTFTKSNFDVDWSVYAGPGSLGVRIGF